MKFREFFASSDKKSHLSARVMVRTVQLLRHDAYCPISAEIGTVDSHSDLRIGGAKCRVHSQARKLPVREKLKVVSFILLSDLLSLKTQRVLKDLWKNLVGKNQLTLLAFLLVARNSWIWLSVIQRDKHIAVTWTNTPDTRCWMISILYNIQ